MHTCGHAGSDAAMLGSPVASEQQPQPQLPPPCIVLPAGELTPCRARCGHTGGGSSQQRSGPPCCCSSGSSTSSTGAGGSHSLLPLAPLPLCWAGDRSSSSSFSSSSSGEGSDSSSTCSPAGDAAAPGQLPDPALLLPPDELAAPAPPAAGAPPGGSLATAARPTATPAPSGSSSSSSTALTSLPLEALSIIAALLESPERAALALSCTAGRLAVAGTAASLVLPGSELCGLQQQDASDGACSSIDESACGSGCCLPAQQQQQKRLQQLLWRYIGVASLKLTGCLQCCSQAALQLPPGLQQLQAQQQLMLMQLGLSASPLLQAATGGGSSSLGSSTLGSALHASAGLPPGWTMPGLGLGFSRQFSFGWLGLAASTTATAAGQAAAASSTGGGCSMPAFVAAAGSSLPRLTHLDLSCSCAHSLIGSPRMAPKASGTSGSGTASRDSLLGSISSACPRLASLSLPAWLWTGTGNALAAEMVLAALAAGFLSPSQIGRVQGSLRAAGFNQACCELEQLSSLSRLAALRVLKLSGPPVPLEVLRQLSSLAQLASLSLNVASDLPAVTAAAAAASAATTAAAAAAGAASGAAAAPAAGSDGGSGGGDGGTVLGAALARLTGLTHLSLTGLRNVASSCLRQLSSLRDLSHLDLVDSTDLKVQALCELAAATSLKVLRIRRFATLQLKARPALPRELTALQQLAVLILDCDLHLRDVQVLAGLPQLSLLSAASVHCCVSPSYQLRLPAVRHLALHSLPLLPRPVPVPPAVQAGLQQAIQQALQQQQQGGAAQAQQQQHPPAVLQQAGQQQALLVQLLPAGIGNPPQQQGQQQQFVLLQGPLAQAAAAAAQAGAAAAIPAAPPGGQQQQQQVPAAAAGGWNLPQQPQQPQQFVLVPGPAAAGAAAQAADQQQQHPWLAGWLALLCPFLVELLVGVVDDKLFAAIDGHPTLKRLVLGGSASGASASGSAAGSSAGAAAGAAVAQSQQPQQQLSHEAWAVLSGLPRLEYLKIGDTTATLPPSGAGIPLMHMTNLCRLSLQRSGCVNDNQAWLLGSLCTRLERLTIEDASLLSDAGLSCLSSLPRLTHLQLTRCTAVTSAGLEQLLVTCTSLRSVHLVGCTAVAPDRAAAVQAAVPVGGGRKVKVTWRSTAKAAGGGSSSSSTPWEP